MMVLLSLGWRHAVDYFALLGLALPASLGAIILGIHVVRHPCRRPGDRAFYGFVIVIGIAALITSVTGALSVSSWR